MRQSLPDLALELSMDGIVLHQRTSPGQWAELGATRLDAPNLAANLRAMRDMAGTARGRDFRTQIWLPEEQVISHNLLLTGETRKERDRSAINALAAITPHAGEDFAIAMGAPSVSGYTPVAAVLLQTLKEARVFAKENGFRPVGFSSRVAPAGFDFTPAFSEPPDYGPLKRKLSFVAGMGMALLAGGIGFRVADPYEIWLIPPQEIAAPAGLPDAPESTGISMISLAGSLSPAALMPRPDDISTPEDASQKSPVFESTAAQSAALVAAPRWLAPISPRQIAAPPPHQFGIAPNFASVLALKAPTSDQLPAQSGPKLQQRVKGLVASPGIAGEGVIVASAVAWETLTQPPGEIAAPQTRTPDVLPRPTITRAYALDNLNAIIAAFELLELASTSRRNTAARPDPEPDFPNSLHTTTGPHYSMTSAALTPPQNQPATAAPDIGLVALLRPLGRPAGRPENLRTEGDFESAIARPETDTPPALALVVPPDIPEQSAETAPSDTPPLRPMTDVSWLSSPLADTAEPRSGYVAIQIVAFAAWPDLQVLSRPGQSDPVATAYNPAEPETGALVARNTPPQPPLTEVSRLTNPQPDLNKPAPEKPALENLERAARPEAPPLAKPTPEDQALAALNPAARTIAQSSDADSEGTVQAIPEPPPDPFAEYASKRPRARPASFQQLAAQKLLESPTEYALLTSRQPRERPATLELRAAAARRVEGLVTGLPPTSAESQDEPDAGGTTYVSIPTSASVQRAATVKNVINRSKIALMGVYGTPANRRALIRLPSGRFVRVKTGDKFSGYQVALIDANSIRLLLNGRSQTLKMPN